MNVIDLRSDTVTHPSRAMRDAMYKAEVGDDVYGEDPTVNRLQKLAAERTGKEAALFVPSGTMGNFISLLTHCTRGDEAIIGSHSHIALHEQGGAATLGGIYLKTARNAADGTLALDEIEDLISKGDDDHVATTRLVCLENTWNGRVLTSEYLDSAVALARKHDLKMHLDGARIFNAAVALNCPVAELCKHFDSIQFCLSKGLASPTGSMICGSREFIHKAKRNRKMVGGGMRQIGIIAAAGIVSLEQMVDRLAEDHANARLLSEGLAGVPGIKLDPESVETNMVIFGLDPAIGMTPVQFVTELEVAGVRMIDLDRHRVRAVTHFGIEKEHIEKAVEATKSVLSRLLSGSRK